MLYVIRLIYAFVLFAVAIEASVRVDDWYSYGAPVLENYNVESLYEQDAVGKRGKPYAHYLKWKLNSLGLRGPELRQGSVRVATVGSSETFGISESPGHEWPRALEKRINQSDRPQPVDVANLSYPGMLLVTFAKRLPEYLNLVDPQVVIVYPSPVGYINREAAIHYTMGESAEPPPELRIASRVQTVFKRIAPPWVIDWVQEQQAQRIFASTPKVMDRAPESLFEYYYDDLVLIVTELEKRGVPVILVTHATYFGAELDESERSMMMSWRKFYPALSEKGLLDLERRANEVLHRVAREHGLPLVDAAAQIPTGAEHFADFVHFTDRGAEELANLIYEEAVREALAKLAAAAPHSVEMNDVP